MRTHNAWHLAMFDAEEGNVESAIGILDNWLLPASALSALDACDAAALLWRLTIEGIDDAGRWRKISNAFERTPAPGFWPYVDLHAALAHLLAGHRQRADRLMRAVERCAEGSDYSALRARNITLPGLHALGAWAAGRYTEAARLLSALRPTLSEAGGSRVQLELFNSIEREAVSRQRAQVSDFSQLTSATEQTMPLINVKLIEGVFTEPQKKQIAKSLTDALVQIEGEAMRSVTWCLVEEVKSGDWAIGGQPLTTADVKSIATQKAA
jgi:4-oxalocrotonate tautomerase